MLKRVETLGKEVFDLSTDVANKQSDWQKIYQDDLTTITHYASKDFRGTAWKDFDPEKDLTSIHAQAKVTTPTQSEDLRKINKKDPPSELDYAQIQSDVDQIKTIQTRFSARCSTTPDTSGGRTPPGCDLDVRGALDTLTTALDEATALLTILQDNFKTLQTAQTAVTSSVAAQTKFIPTSFIARTSRNWSASMMMTTCSINGSVCHSITARQTQEQSAVLPTPHRPINNGYDQLQHPLPECSCADCLSWSYGDIPSQE